MNVEKYRESFSHEEFCLLLAYLKYYDESFEYDKTMRLKGYLLDAYDLYAVKNGFEA